MRSEYSTTKERLKDAARSLLEKKAFHKISVKDIIEESGLSRPAFYKYFRDKYDIANSIYMDDINPIIEEYYKDYNFYNVSLSSFRLFKKNQLIYRRIFEDTDIQNSLYKYLIDEYRKFMTKRIGEKT